MECEIVYRCSSFLANQCLPWVSGDYIQMAKFSSETV